MGSVVSASNLFKYCAPAHGLLLFKHHDPHAFTAANVQELLLAGSRWFEAAATAAAGSGSASWEHSESGGGLSAGSTPVMPSSPQALQPSQSASRRFWPLLLWNNLPRAGASQFHGHAQTALSEVSVAQQFAFRKTIQFSWNCLMRGFAVVAQVPFPADLHMMQASAAYEAEHCGACCYDDMWHAHAALGLAHEYGPPEDRYVYAKYILDCSLRIPASGSDQGVSLQPY